MLNNRSWENKSILNKELRTVLTTEQTSYIKNQHRTYLATSNLFMKIVKYNTRNGLKLRSLNNYLSLVQIFFKIFKIMSRKRRRRTRRYVILKNFEFLFQKVLNSKQLLLTKKLVRQRGRHKNFDYKFVALYKNKRINHLMYWLRLLSYKYASRRYLTRILYVYYDFLFFNKHSYTFKLHKSLRAEYFLKKKKKIDKVVFYKKRSYLGKINIL